MLFYDYLKDFLPLSEYHLLKRDGPTFLLISEMEIITSITKCMNTQLHIRKVEMFEYPDQNGIAIPEGDLLKSILSVECHGVT